MRPVVVVQHEPSVPPGSITEVLARSNVPHRVVDAWQETDWPRATDASAVVVMGGTMNVDELDAYPFLRQSRALMADAIENGVPTLGVCLGSQMMARVLGGDVYRTEPRNAFFSPIEIDAVGDDPLIAPFATGVEVLQFHEDTFTVPPGARPLARSERSGLHQAFRYGDSAYAIQFHFEVDDAIVRDWCRDIGAGALATEWGTSEAELIGDARGRFAAQQAAGRELVRSFVALARRDPATMPAI
ncbi:MAG TPA: type 1 glutamine amidotransferase [Actinomycetota bacterium]|jgi:GMP synthase-like glutamine amidotransferase